MRESGGKCLFLPKGSAIPKKCFVRVSCFFGLFDPQNHTARSSSSPAPLRAQPAPQHAVLPPGGLRFFGERMKSSAWLLAIGYGELAT